MILFNATNFILDVQDRIILSHQPCDYPELESTLLVTRE